MEVIKSVRLNYTYGGGVEALKDVSIVVGEGKVVAILGPNGAGKTTLLKCLLNILKPKGAVYIYGRDISKLGGRELAKLLGYVPQTYGTVFAYRVLDFVVMGRAPHHSIFSLPSEGEYRRALEVLDMLGIKDLAWRTIAEVSGGQLQLVMIARALIQDAKVLLLDEPTAHLDISNRLRVMRVIKDLVRRGIVDSVVVAMHDPLIAGLFSDEVVLMSRGEVVAYGEPKEVLTPGNLRRVYGIEFVVINYFGKPLVVPKELIEE